MEKLRSSNSGQNPAGPNYRMMQRSELEAVAITAIKEHRRLLLADEAMYETWIRADDDPSMTSCVLKSLQSEYLARQETSKAQQRELAKILDALGFIPTVPEE
jgi:hypothetical protein